MTKFQQIAGIEWLWLRISWESISSGERLKQYEEIILFFLFCFWGDNEGDGFLWIESTNWRIEIISFWIFSIFSELNQLKNWDDIILKLWLSLNWTNCRIEMILFWIFSIFSELNQPIEELRWYYFEIVAGTRRSWGWRQVWWKMTNLGEGCFSRFSFNFEFDFF